MGGLLSIADIEFDKDAKNQSLKLNINPLNGNAYIKINRDFVSQHAYQPSRFAALLAHELLHHLFRHYVKKSDGHMSDLAQDMIINSIICQRSDGFGLLFTDIYDKRTFPSLLLRPNGNIRAYQKLPEHIYRLISSLHAGLWPKSSYSHAKYTLDDVVGLLSDIHSAVKLVYDECIKNQTDIPEWFELFERSWYEDSFVLGDHETTEDDLKPVDENDAGSIEPLVHDLTGELADGLGSGLFSSAFKIEVSRGPDELAEALNQSLRKDITLRQEIIEVIVGTEMTESSQVPYYIGRKEAFLLANEQYPTAYPTFGPSEDAQTGGDVRIYLDVSGSMGDQSHFLLMLLTGFKNRVASELYEFSTEIATVNFGQLVERFQSTGELSLQTTGGTAFDPIFEHARKNDYRKILIVTDGYARVNSSDLFDWAKNNEVYVLYTQKHDSTPLEKLTKKSWVMPELPNPVVTKVPR